MTITAHTISEIVQAYLVAEGLVVDGGAVGDWPAYVDHLPDDPEETDTPVPVPDSAVCVYTTTALGDGRYMRTGERVEHPGFQVRVRSRSRASALAKANAIASKLDTVKRATVVVGGSTYRLDAAHRQGGVIPMGQEPGDRRRWHFSVNGTATVSNT